MKVLLDLLHPAHVHFFRNPIRLLTEGGHEVHVTSRRKDCTLDLLDEYRISHQCISNHSTGGVLAMAHELLTRNRALARVVRRIKPAVMAGIGGISIAQVGRLMRVPSVVFYDTELARLQNTLTYPFATRIVVPECYSGKVPKRKTIRYRGYHELSYLHPDIFHPNQNVALQNGLSVTKPTIFIRLVSWRASHDIGIKGWDRDTLYNVISWLKKRAHVIISSESPLPGDLAHLAYKGDTAQIHHLLAHCRLYVGESATMASEAVVMGVPAIYAAPGFRGYVSHQETQYQLARFIPNPTATSIIAACDDFLQTDRQEINHRHEALLSECTNVNRMITALLLDSNLRMPDDCSDS